MLLMVLIPHKTATPLPQKLRLQVKLANFPLRKRDWVPLSDEPIAWDDAASVASDPASDSESGSMHPFLAPLDPLENVSSPGPSTNEW